MPQHPYSPPVQMRMLRLGEALFSCSKVPGEKLPGWEEGTRAW